MIDDHDECEWMNVSSSTSLPTLYQKKIHITVKR